MQECSLIFEDAAEAVIQSTVQPSSYPPIPAMPGVSNLPLPIMAPFPPMPAMPTNGISEDSIDSPGNNIFSICHILCKLNAFFYLL